MTKARGWAEYFEKLSRLIPGMKGYQDKEGFRDADKAVRVAVAGKLGEVKKVLENAKRDLVDDKKIMDLEYIDRAHRKLQKIAETVRLDSYGYSGYFDPVKIREPELERMYQFDLALFDDVDKLNRLAQAISGSSNIRADSKKVEEGIDAFETLLKKRRDFDAPK